MNSTETVLAARRLIDQSIEMLETEIKETKRIQEQLAAEVERLTSANNTSQELVAVLRAEIQQQRAALDKLQTKEPVEPNI